MPLHAVTPVLHVRSQNHDSAFSRVSLRFVCLCYGPPACYCLHAATLLRQPLPIKLFHMEGLQSLFIWIRWGNRGESLYLFIHSPAAAPAALNKTLHRCRRRCRRKQEVDAQCCSSHGNALGTDSLWSWDPLGSVSRCPINPLSVARLFFISSAPQIPSHSTVITPSLLCVWDSRSL